MTTLQQPWLIPPHKNRAARPKEAGMADNTETADLVARLRDQQSKWMTPLLSNAADALEAQAAKIEAAKAAAQADYAARIIAALDPAALAAMLADARANALREAAATAYRVCAETRHVTLGRAAEAATLALIDKEPQT
jgi:hypothetical protein